MDHGGNEEKGPQSAAETLNGFHLFIETPADPTKELLQSGLPLAMGNRGSSPAENSFLQK